MSQLRKTPEGKEKHPTDEEIECQNYTKLQKETRSIVQMKGIECQNYAKLQKEKRNIVQMKEIECQNYAKLQKEKEKHHANETNRRSELC